MPIQLSRLPNEAVITAVFTEPVDYHSEVPEMFKHVIELRDTIEDSDRYFFILDVSAVRMSFSDVVYTMGETRIAREQRREDMPVSLMLVGSGTLMDMAVKALGQKQYGSYGMQLYTSLDDALGAIREVV